MATIAQHTLIMLGGTGGSAGVYTTIAGVKSFSGPSLSQETIDVTDLDDTWKSFLAAGVADAGELTIDINLEPDLAIHDTLIDLAGTGTLRDYLVCFSDLADNTDGVDSVTNATDTIEVTGHGFVSGQPVRITTDTTLPDPLVAGVTYYVIRINDNTFKLAATNALAVDGTPINLVDDGAGTHTMTFGTTYSFTGYITGADDSGAVGEALAGSITMKINDSITITGTPA